MKSIFIILGVAALANAMSVNRQQQQILPKQVRQGGQQQIWSRQDDQIPMPGQQQQQRQDCVDAFCPPNYWQQQVRQGGQQQDRQQQDFLPQMPGQQQMQGLLNRQQQEQNCIDLDCETLPMRQQHQQQQQVRQGGQQQDRQQQDFLPQMPGQQQMQGWQNRQQQEQNCIELDCETLPMRQQQQQQQVRQGGQQKVGQRQNDQQQMQGWQNRQQQQILQQQIEQNRQQQGQMCIDVDCGFDWPPMRQQQQVVTGGQNGGQNRQQQQMWPQQIGQQQTRRQYEDFLPNWPGQQQMQGLLNRQQQGQNCVDEDCGFDWPPKRQQQQQIGQRQGDQTPMPGQQQQLERQICTLAECPDQQVHWSAP